MTTSSYADDRPRYAAVRSPARAGDSGVCRWHYAAPRLACAVFSDSLARFCCLAEHSLEAIDHSRERETPFDEGLRSPAHRRA